MKEGYYTEIYPRSSIYKTDFISANSVGIIDSDYRGTIFMPVRYVGQNNGLEEASKLVGTRVAQLILRKKEILEIDIVDSLEQTDRAEGGFGSTGTKELINAVD